MSDGDLEPEFMPIVGRLFSAGAKFEGWLSVGEETLAACCP
tara:strand:+ start:726 stop:848 length:123 start_codon:yes stop_codon:yes gene_type:complete